jgi:2-hydroxycyclohexanecarboxyl-CoA dehydrogenase
VASIDIDSEGATVVADETGGIAIAFDLSDLEAIPSVVTDLVEELGSIGILVNCAGWDRAMPFDQTDRDFWLRVVAVNLLGPIALTHAVLPHMPEGAAIVNISSDAGRVGSSGEVVYSAAKAGVIGFSKALAREVAARGIRVNVVAPGPTAPPVLERFDEPGKLAAARERQKPHKKQATAEDVAAAIAFLGSDDAGHITGQVLSVSGGLTMV